MSGRLAIAGVVQLGCLGLNVVGVGCSLWRQDAGSAVMYTLAACVAFVTLEALGAQTPARGEGG